MREFLRPRFRGGIRVRAVALAIGFAALCVACGHDHDHGEGKEATAEEELPGGSVTLWTERSELFMEHPALIVGQPDKFLVHLTALSDFAPLRSGRIRLRFEAKDGGSGFEVVQDEPRAPGIYGPIPDFPRPGVWSLHLDIESPQVADTIEVPDLHVYARAEDVPREEAGADEGIAFLKEQQWKTPGFRTAFAREGTLEASVEATGQIVAVAGRSAQITAPVPGWIDAAGLPAPLVPGQLVQRGQTLALLVPALGDEGSSVAEARRALREAQDEHARAQRLVKAEAIPERRLHEAQIQLDAAREALSGLGAAAPGSGAHVAIRSPIAGTLTQIDLELGRRIDAGAPVFAVLDASTVWLRVDVAADVAPRIGTDSSASFQVEGLPRSYPTARLLSVGAVVDARTRTVPLWFEVKNADGTLKVGSSARASVRTSEARSGVLVPRSAILEEDGRPIVYVQAEGERFEKRAVELATTDAEQALLASGVQPGERVVTGAAYQVRLASLSTSVPAHGHEH